VLLIAAGSVLVAALLIVIRLQIGQLNEMPRFSAEITGELTGSFSSTISGDAASLGSGSRPFVGKFQVIGFASKSKMVLVSLSYLGDKMPPAGTYPIEKDPRKGVFFGRVMDYSKVGDTSSLASIFQAAINTVEYVPQKGSISFDEVDGNYSGQFNFTALHDSPESSIEVVGTFENIGYETAQ
jgi:hypothetical protein